MPAWSRPERVDDRWVLRSPKSGVVVAHLIDAGLDAINPVQITCAEMDAAGLKRDFGRDLTFWGGGGDTRDILPLGSPEKIREHVLRQLEILSPGGGYVFQPIGPVPMEARGVSAVIRCVLTKNHRGQQIGADRSD